MTAAQPAVTATHATLAPPLQPAQLKSRLWADDAQTVYAVVMGNRVPDLPARLARAEVAGLDCLLPGALAPAQRLAAPFLVQLRRESTFTDWLLFEAAAGLEPWGVMVLSQAPRLVLRAHLRELLQPRLPDGTEIELAWMDPDILLTLLPLFEPAALARFMGPLHALAVADAQEWTFIQLALRQLQLERVPVARAA